MLTNLGIYLPTSVRATGAILNPWYELPMVDSVLSDKSIQEFEITSLCRLELEAQSLSLLFYDYVVVFLFTGGSSAPYHLFHPLRYFLSYKSFINFNLIGPVVAPLDVNNFDKVDRLHFKLERVTSMDTKRRDGDKVVEGPQFTRNEEQLEITKDSISRYLHVLNPTLYYSLTFYLIGCENPRYFLIEFHKAVEVIKNVFSSEDEFLTSLQPHGVTKRKYRDFRKVCNDMQLAPLDIGRHAPMPGAPVYAVDLRNLLVAPRSRDILESATEFCRQVIDAYIAFLNQQAA